MFPGILPIDSLVGGLLGGKQVGQAAPSPGNIGGQQNPSLGQITPEMLQQFMPRIDPVSINPLADAQAGLPSTVPTEQPGPPVERAGTEEPSGFLDKFFGSIDNTFQSPAKLLGVGLLNQIKPGAGTLGLGLSGLLGAFRK